MKGCSATAEQPFFDLIYAIIPTSEHLFPSIIPATTLTNYGSPHIFYLERSGEHYAKLPNYCGSITTHALSARQ